MSDELLKRLMEAIVRIDMDAAGEASEAVSAAGVPSIDILNRCLVPALEQVGVLFRDGEYFLPDVLMCVNLYNGIFKRIEADLKQGNYKSRGKVMLGTVKGDTHDIGKNNLSALLQGNGFEVINLGMNVPPEVFLAKAREMEPDVIGTSALLTTTLPGMQTTIKLFKQAALRERFKIVLGGAGPAEGDAGVSGAGSPPAAADRPLGMKEIVLYNMTGIPLNLYDTVLMAWVMYFYIPPQNMGRIPYLSIAAISIILAGGRILDAVTDPLVGYLSDHSSSRWGRRKPFIFVSLPILFLSFVLVWAPPVAGPSIWNAVFLGAVLFFYYWAYTGVLIPWFAVLPEMSRENRERVKISTTGVAISTVGVLIGGGLSGPLIEGMGPLKMALILGVVAFIAGEISLLGIKERYLPQPDEMPLGAGSFFRVLKQVFFDRQVLSFLVMIMLAQMTYQLMLMNVPYSTTLVLGGKESDASLLMGILVVIMALATPFWFRMLSRFPKRNIFRLILLWMAVAYIGCFMIGSPLLGASTAVAVVFFAVVMIPYGGMFATVLGIIADISDYDELKSGGRREAVYYGIYGIVRKTGWAFCSLIIGGVFSLFGYSAENPLGVRVVFLICSLVCFAAFLAFIPYRLGDSRAETAEIMNLGQSPPDKEER